MTQANPTALLRQTHIDTIHALFADPPSLRAVAQASAQAHLDEHFAARTLAVEQLYLRTPLASQTATYDYTALADALVARLVNGEPVLYVPGHHESVQRVGDDYEPSTLDLFECEVLVNERGALLLASYREQLQAWWKTRWWPLVEALMGVVSDTPRQPGMSQRHLDTFFSLSFTNPGGELAAPAGPLRVSTVHLRREDAGDDDSGEILPLWLLQATHSTDMALYSPAMGVQLIDQLDDIGPLLADHLSPLLDEPAGEWFVVEHAGLAPESLASGYLARQLSEIAAIDPTVRRTAQQYQALLNAITDTRRWFVSPLTAFGQGVHEAIPAWLFNAAQTDRLQYGRLLVEQVRHLNQGAGKRFFPEVPSLAAFAETALQDCLDNEPRAVELKVLDIHGVFGPPSAAPLELTLTEWALETLGGFTPSPTTVTLKGAPAPAWLTEPLLRDWLAKADIAKTYGAVLRQRLAKGNAAKDWDRDLAGDQVLSQLKMLAMAYKIQGLHGLTQQGYRLISERAAGLRASSRLLPLTLKAMPQGQTAVVQHMHLLMPRQAPPGACLLYRPLLNPVVQEFASLEDLHAAIKAPGALRDSVLAWLPTSHRAVFEPLLSALPVDDNAALAVEVSEDLESVHSLREAFYLALETLSEWPVSGGDARHWACFKEAGWSLTDGLMPLVQGVDTLTGWLGQLMDTVRQDVGATRGVDVLGNLAWVLAQRVSPANVQLQLDLSALMFATPQRVQNPLELTRIPAPKKFKQPDKWGSVLRVKALIQQARLQTNLRLEEWQALYDGADSTRAEAESRVSVLSSLVDSIVDNLADAAADQVREQYHQILQVKLKALSQQLHALRQLRALAPRLGYEVQVCALLESLVGTARTLGSLEARYIASLDTSLASMSQEQVSENRRNRLAAYNGAIHWRELENRHLDELTAVIGCGADKGQALTLAVAPASVLALQAQQVRRLWQAAWRAEDSGSDAMFAGMLAQTLQRVACASQSHAGFMALTQAERIELFDSVLQVYGDTADRLAFCRAITPQAFDLDSLHELQTLIDELHATAEKNLLEALMDNAPAAAVGAPRNSLIRTRGGDVYRGRIVEPTHAQPARIAQVHDRADELIASFKQAADGLWDPLERAPATLGCARAGTLVEMIEHGKQTVAGVERMIAQVLRMVPTAKRAHSLQDVLAVPAFFLLECAEAMRRKLAQASAARWPVKHRSTAQRIEADWRAAAARLYEQGVHARIAVIKARAPVQAGVDALLAGHEVQLVNRPGRYRVDDAADDYVQFCQVVDVHTRQPEGYIHLYYQQAVGRDDLFTAAYLKTPEQHHATRQTELPLSFSRWMTPTAATILADHRRQVSRSQTCRWMADADTR